MRSLMNPRRYGFYSLQFLSHKLLRRLLFLPLGILLAASPLLWNHGILYQVANRRAGGILRPGCDEHMVAAGWGVRACSRSRSTSAW